MSYLIKDTTKQERIELSQDMFAQIPDEYHALKQEVLLKKDCVNETLLIKIKDAGYISSYDIKEEICF